MKPDLAKCEKIQFLDLCRTPNCLQQMHIESPTRREVYLAILLLVSLLFVSQSRPDFDLPASVQTGSSDKQATPNSSNVEQAIAPQSLRDRIRWGAGEIPQTQILAHVPGEWCLW